MALSIVTIVWRGEGELMLGVLAALFGAGKKGMLKQEGDLVNISLERMK